MLVMVLLFGMTGISCDNDTTDNTNNSGNGNGGTTALAGTWVGTQDSTTMRIISANNSFNMSIVGGTEYLHGTYTQSGNSVILTVTKMNPYQFGGSNQW